MKTDPVFARRGRDCWEFSGASSQPRGSLTMWVYTGEVAGEEGKLKKMRRGEKGRPTPGTVPRGLSLE